MKKKQFRWLKNLLPLLLLVMVLGGLQVNAATATVTVNTATTYQTLDGFGAACAWQGELLTGNSSKSAIYDLLFKNNLDILRLRNTYGSRNGATFCPYEQDLVSQAKSRNPNLKVFLVSWSPPSNLKANGTLNGGTLAKVNNAFNYSGFGTYWRDSLAAYQGKGITPDYISIQNEPDYVNSGWETCRLDPTEGANASYGKCLDAVVSSISTVSPRPKILGPEASYIASNLVQNYMNNLTQSNIDIVGHHLYSSSGDANNPDSFISNLQSLYNSYPGKPKWQSEYDYGSALNHGIIIYNSLVYEQVSAYLFWDLVWNGGTALINLPNLPSSSYTVTDYFYVVKQFAGWTNPGYKRIAVTSNNSGVRATGFVNGNSLSIILINTSGSSATVSLNLNVGVASSTVYQTTPGGSDKCANKGSLGSGNSVTVANNSIATVVITTGSIVTTPTPTPTQTGPTPTPISGGSISIACGSSSAVGGFQADQYYSGGSTYSNTNTVDVSQITSNPPPAALFNNERYGAMSYTIPGLTAGNLYEVTLYFAETYLTSSGSRRFNVSINSASVLSNFDIYVSAGGQNKAIARTFTATANASGQMVIQFTNVTENAKINGISIKPGISNPTPTPSSTIQPTPTPSAYTGPTPTPTGTVSIAIAAGRSSGLGSFQADQYYSGGSTYSNSNTIDVSQITSNPPPAALFNNERYGAMSYTIPGFTAGNSYTVTLYFAETYLTASGRRLFNVSINGGTVLSNFDIYASAEGQNKAIARMFTVTANENGQIVIQFTSGTENPKINGISIKSN